MLVFGKRFYGKVLRCRDAYVATQFFHFWFIPLIPLGSVIVLRPLENNQLQTVKTPMHWGSVGLAYLRGWSIFMLLHGLLNWMEPAHVNGAYYGPVVSVLAAVGIVVSFFVLGRTSAATKARFEVYARVFGHPIDLALLGPAGSDVAAWLRSQIVAHDVQLGAHYRAAYDPATQWAEIALDPSMRDPRFLTHALCLARIERTTAQGDARRALDATHDRIWARLCELDATVTAPARTPAQPTA